MTALGRLIEHWRTYKPDAPPLLHPRDVAFAVGKLEGLHTHVSAYPYVGDLKRADIWLLMLNSKLGPHDQMDEGREPYRSLFRKNLNQELEKEEFPLISLDPALAATGTYQYYNHTRGLASLIEAFAGVSGLRSAEARRTCARRIAILELLPYRSSSFPPNLTQLPSVNLARAAAREASETKLLVVPWALDRWGLKRSSTVLNRPARTFSFAPGGASGYGEAILQRLLMPSASE